MTPGTPELGNRLPDDNGFGLTHIMAKKRPTSDRLRADIDQGKQGDKVNYSDPAAAPLGTDDEAADTPPTAQQLEMASHRSNAGRSARAPDLGVVAYVVVAAIVLCAFVIIVVFAR